MLAEIISLYENYNILVEGDLYNNTEEATFYVTTSGMAALYAEGVSYRLSIGDVSSLVSYFSSSVDVDHLVYKVDPIVLNDISITYGTNNYNEYSCTPVISGSDVYASIDTSINYLCITHSGSVFVNVNNLYLYPTSINDTTFSGNGFLDSSPAFMVAPTAQELTIKNNSGIDRTYGISSSPFNGNAGLAVAVSSGTFYGPNEYGVKQAAFVPLSDISNSLCADTLDLFFDDWEKQISNKSYFVSSSDYYTMVVENQDSADYRRSAPWNSYTLSFFVSKTPFTPDQSFSFGLDIRIYDAPLENLLGAGATQRNNKFLVGFSDSYPIRDHSIFIDDNTYPSDDRTGRSMAAIWLGGKKQGTVYDDLYVGALANDRDFFSYRGYTNLDAERTKGSTSGEPLISSIKLEDLSSKVFRENSYNDGTERAPWRKLFITYDHLSHQVCYYIDSVLIAEQVFSRNAFSDKCHLFFGFDGLGGITIDMRNVFVKPNVVLYPYQLINNITLSSALDDTYSNGRQLIDGIYDEAVYSSAWLGRVYDTETCSISAALDSTFPIEAIRLRKPGISDTITVSGVSSPAARYSVKSLMLNFDTGDTRIAYFNDPTIDGVAGWDCSYLVTLSGTVEAVQGASAVSGTISSFYDRGSGDSIFVIDELEFYAVSGTRTTHINTYGDYPWYKGSFFNTAVNGDGLLAHYYSDVYDVSTKETCFDLVAGVDYGADNYVYDNTLSNIYYSYAESLFKREDSGSTNHSASLSVVASSKTASVWRRFDAVFDIKAVLFSFYANPQSGNMFEGKPDKWKLQKLKIGGSVSVDEDWIDILPISTPYGVSGDYYTYTSYLISNNDGEYYTSYINSMDSLGGYVDLPDTILAYKNRFNKLLSLSGFSTPVSNCYIELDSVCRTQAIRLVVADGYNDTSRNVGATGYSFKNFVCYSEKAIGVYTSPVLDVDSSFNTERIHVNAVVPSGVLNVLYRSSDYAPEYSYNSKYERWEDLGMPFSSLDEIPSIGTSVSLFSYGDDVYVFDDGIDRIITYTPSTNKWSYGDYFPEESSGESVFPDTRTRNPIIVLGDEIILAMQSSDGNVTNSSLFKYNKSANDVLYTGWEPFPYQRQPDAVYACLVGDGERYGYFLSKDGTITVFDKEDGSLDNGGRADMPLHGSSYREGFVASYNKGKIYVCGGSLGCTSSFDIYDIASDKWVSGPDMPFGLEYAWSLYSNGFIYVLPYYPASSFSAFMKYDIALEKWITLPTLSYNTQTSYLDVGSSWYGNHPVHNSYTLFDGDVIGFNTIRSDFRRFSTNRSTWSSGNRAFRDDSVWGSSFVWNNTISGSEFMPQHRYMQYKLVFELESPDMSAAVDDVTLVKAQEITLSSGVESNIYVKTDIDTDYDAITYCTVFDGDSSYYACSVENRGPAVVAPLSISSFTAVSGAETYTNNSMALLPDRGVGYIDYGIMSGYSIDSPDIYRIVSDDGYFWNKAEAVVLKGTEGVLDSDGACTPWVLNNGSYKMWYIGIANDGSTSILFNSSVDGISWGSSVLALSDSNYVYDEFTDVFGVFSPSVVFVDPYYYLLYEGENSNGVRSVFCCTSVDGISWYNSKPIITYSTLGLSGGKGVGSPCVVYDGGVFRLWLLEYTHYGNVVWYGTSYNVYNWADMAAVYGSYFRQEREKAVCTSVYAYINREGVDINKLITPSLKIYNG